jgi:hypothetical protein
MPYQVREFVETPNPNALKCVLDKPAASAGSDRASRSYFTSEQGALDPVAAALFAIEGVTNVLVVKDWVTVGKSAEARWDRLKPKIKAALGRVADGETLGDGGDGGAGGEAGGGGA